MLRRKQNSTKIVGKFKLSPATLKILMRGNLEILNIVNISKYSNKSFLIHCFSDVEVDLEDLLTNPFNTQPPSLDEIQRLTGFRRDWLMFVYRNFKQVSFGFYFSLYKH